MVMINNVLQQDVNEMKGMADLLIPYTFPRVDFKVEQEVLLLKQRSITVDGYDIIACYSKADYGHYFLESLQLQAIYTSFLPFTLICKLGRVFLGSSNLSYVEFFKNSRKVYCWTIKSRDGRSLLPDNQTKPGSYEGFEFNILQPGSVDLF